MLRTKLISGIGGTVFGRFIKIDYDTELRPYFLYQYEWINPRPEIPIRSLTLSNEHSPFFNPDIRHLRQSARMRNPIPVISGNWRQGRRRRAQMPVN
jgi:hypothetical protein